MKWDQIERKWALMTCRIRADWRDERVKPTEVSIQTLKRGDPVAPSLADSRSFVVQEAEFKTSPK